MKPGPKARAKRQKKRDARNRAAKTIGQTLKDRAEWSSLSGKALAGRPRTRRVPAYEIRIRRTVATAPEAVAKVLAGLKAVRREGRR